MSSNTPRRESWGRVTPADWNDLHQLGARPTPDTVIVRIASEHAKGNLARHGLRVIYRTGTLMDDQRSPMTRKHGVDTGVKPLPIELAEPICKAAMTDPRQVVVLESLGTGLMIGMEKLRISDKPSWDALYVDNADLWDELGEACLGELYRMFGKSRGKLSRAYQKDPEYCTKGIFMRIQVADHILKLLRGKAPDPLHFNDQLRWLAPLLVGFIESHQDDRLPALDPMPTPPNIAKK